MFVLIAGAAGFAVLVGAYVARERLGSAATRRLKIVAAVLLLPSAGVGLWVYLSGLSACSQLAPMPEKIDNAEQRCREINHLCNGIFYKYKWDGWEDSALGLAYQRVLAPFYPEGHVPARPWGIWFEREIWDPAISLDHDWSLCVAGSLCERYSEEWRDRAPPEELRRYDALRREQRGLRQQQSEMRARHDHLVRVLKERKHSFWLGVFVPAAASRYELRYTE